MLPLWYSNKSKALYTSGFLHFSIKQINSEVKMKTETQNAGLDYEVGRTLLKPRGTNLTFVHPKYGPNTYANVKGQIEKDNLKPATMAETASLIHAAFNSENPFSEEIRELMKNKYILAFTGSLCLPKNPNKKYHNGALIKDNPETRDGMPFMDESELVKKLESNDKSVRFIPFGYKTESMSSLELAKNPYVVALAGQDGAEKLAEVADKHQRQPYLGSFKSVEQPLTRVSALDSYWGLGSRLIVFGYYRGYGRDGSAFGGQVAP